MSRLLALLPLALAAGVLFAARPAAQSAGSGGDPGCPNPIPHEPVILVGVSGGTLLGPVHAHLAIYSSGLASFSEQRPGGFGLAPTVRVGTLQLAPADLVALRRGLELAGASFLCDQAQTVLDVPLTTVTVLRGGPRAQAHTFSYWLPSGAYAPVQDVIDQALATYFPGG